MKIIFVDTTVHQPPIGGGHLYLPGLMKGLIERGHEVHLVVKAEPDKKIAGLIHDSKAIVHIKPWKKDGLVEDITPLFADWVNRMAPDVYLISGSADVGWTVLPLLNPSIATLATAHNDTDTFYLPVTHYHTFLTRAIGVSPQICEYYNTKCRVPSEKIKWIPYGVSASSIPPVPPENGDLQIVYVGRIVEEQKRISDLVKIVQLLVARNTGFRLTIVGDGDDAPKVRSLLEPEIQLGKVELKGWLDHAEIINILHQSEVFVLTSAYEGFSIALVEAMANGCSPVVTDIRSGNKEIVKDAVNGFVISVGDCEKFADRILMLAGDREMLGNMRVKAWEKGQQFSFAVMIRNYEQCFSDAIAEAKQNLRETDTDFPLMSTCRSKYPAWLRRLKWRLVGYN